ncbi:hypothetical protein ARMGADRAFT_1165298 [Armillaria gallica]|uniref:WW domain-containing protein n=1 Tax=Armillaria gallica TaxID=47427 RepID=A0A2H3DQ52_ARMGA|nr:hypothetical protein ARMGADRAFT_1165298 [Armillaria gallica]
MPSTSAFGSSCPQTRWTWIRQILIEATLLSLAIKSHHLPSPVWMLWIASSPSRQASQNPPRRSRPILSRMILKVVGDQFIDETSPSLSAKVSEIAIPYTPPTSVLSLLRLRTKADPWTIRRSSHHSNVYCVRTSSSPGAGDNRIEPPFGSGFSPMSSTNIPSHIFQSLRSQFSGSEGRQCPGQVAESSEPIVQPQCGTPEHTYDWSNDEIKFQEYLPSSIGYYGRKTLIDEFTVPAMQTDFNTCRRTSPTTGEGEVLPMGWTKHTHSDGKPYFYHEHDKIITEEWLYDRDIVEKVARYITILKDAISKRFESFGRLKSWHLYVEIAEYELPAWEGDDRFRCRYYFVNHDAESIFWLSEWRLDIYLELSGEMSPDLIRKYLQREYCVLFAGTNRNDPVYGYDHNPPSPSPLHNREEEHTILFKITKPFLFYASDGYLATLKLIATDRLRSRDHAYVLLAANIAFLAIPSVDVMGANQQLSVTKTLICFSVVVSLGSIIIGLFLSNAHTTLKQGSRSTLLSFIERHCRASRVIEQLAIKYSIPHALLMWG